MTAGSKPDADAGPPGAVFEVERFDWTPDDRLELAGRWFGVRGRRFVRPTLEMRGEGFLRRTLAVLEHKPWAVQDGQPWVCAFPCKGEPLPVTAAELAVSPSLSVALPPPRVRKRARSKPRGAGEPPPDGDGAPSRHQPAESAPRPLHDGGRRAAAAEADVARLRRDREALLQQLAAEQRSVRRLQNELHRVREQLAASGAKLVEHEAVRGEREQLKRDLDAAVSAREAALRDVEAVGDERDAAVRALQSARRDREALERALEAAREARDAAVRERDAALAQRDAARRERDGLVSLREALLAQRDALARQRDAAIAARHPR